MSNKEIPILYSEKKDCCGCGACLNICPKNAISMREDEIGSLYPSIDPCTCVGCGLCKKVCSFQNHEETNSPIECYAAVNKNQEQMALSASGGIFAAIATDVIKKGGIVYGAAFDSEWNVKHQAISDIDKLHILQGSKYTQSETGYTFQDVRKNLDAGKPVLYSGTPCQIAGLKSFLGKSDSNLLTIDIVCHGVPSGRMFRDYVSMLEKKYEGEISLFRFREKSLGNGINGRVYFKRRKRQGSFQKDYVNLWESSQSYFYYFANGCLNRDCCYLCKYACMHRPADITIGDFWGIEKQHPDYIGKFGWKERNGLSLIIANTEHGLAALDIDLIDKKISNFEKVSAGNGQLKHPSALGKRDEIISLYENSGWEAVEDRFNITIGIHRYTSQIKACVPSNIKRIDTIRYDSIK